MNGGIVSVLKINENTVIQMRDIRWKFSRASGPGGQNVNKVSSRVTLLYSIPQSSDLDEDQKTILTYKLGRFIDKQGVLQISVDEERSQMRNREIALQRFAELVRDALTPGRERYESAVPQREKERRIRTKKQRSQLKRIRRQIDDIPEE
jgi:ribosome-associated protein